VKIVSDSSPANRWLSLAEIALIFVLFALQGAWPVPDVNEPHYLGKAAHYWNPAWIQGDFFLDAADSHHVFYFTCGWLTLWLPLPAAAWTGRIVTWLLLAWSWRRLSVAILSPSGATAGLSSSADRTSLRAPDNSVSVNGHSEGTALLDKPAVAPGNTLLPRFGWSILTAALFAMLNERLQMAGEWIIGGFEAKGFAYVFLLLGLEALVKNRWNRAWLLFGAGSAFHPVVGGWAVVAAGFAWLFLGKKCYSSFPRSGVGTQVPDAPASKEQYAAASSTARPKLVSMLPGLFVGFLLSLPGLLPALALNRNLDADTIHRANVIYVFERLKHHLDIFQFKLEFVGWFAELTLCYLLLCLMVNRIAGKELHQELPDNTTADRGCMRITNLQCFVAGVLTIALIGILIDATSFYDRVFAAGLLRFYWFRLADVAVPLGTALIATVWIQQKLSAKSIGAKIGGFAALGLAVISAGIHFGSYLPVRFDLPPARADRLANVAAWQDACRWISENAPGDARFFTPRLSQTFKWHARRAEVATWKDIPQDAASLVEWRRRIQDLFVTGDPQPQFRWRDSAAEMGPEQLEALTEKYRADYIITPVAAPLGKAAVLYRNEGYLVYRIGR
jgi:hypothetical protein